MIDSRVVDEYCALRGLSELDPRQYKVVTIKDTDIARFHEIEDLPPDEWIRRTGQDADR